MEGLVAREVAGRVACYFLCLVALETFIIRGPLRGPVLRVLSVAAGSKTKESRRLLTQSAAKLVGCAFLAVVFPPCFNTLLDPDMRRDKMYAATSISQHTVEVAAGYFLYDLFICLFRYSDNGAEFLLHAVVCCTVYNASAFWGVLQYFGAAFLLWELSTPLLYVRWAMLKAGMAGTRAESLATAAFVLTFFACRCLAGPVLIWDYWRVSAAEMAAPKAGGFHAATLWTIRCMALALNMLNYFWFIQMVRIALGKQRKMSTKAV